MTPQQTLNVILGYLTLLAQVTAQTAPGDVGKDAGLAASLLQIIQAGIAAHNAQTGQPLDLTLIADIEPIT